MAGVVFVTLLFVTAPYGRHTRPGWGPTTPARWGWVLMELPACVGFLAIYFRGSHRLDTVPLILLGLWQWHYVQRTFVFPFRLRASGKRMPLVIALMGATFNLVNAWINATWIAELGVYGNGWLRDPRFLSGAALFAVGWTITARSDSNLIGLRGRGETGYRIPRGGLFRWVSSPHYLGELIEWTGWAVATWSSAGLAFAVFAAANLAPRALSTHRWYRQTFPDYPAERRALIPFLL